MQKFCNSFTSASLSVVQVGCARLGPGLGAWSSVLNSRLAPNFPLIITNLFPGPGPAPGPGLRHCLDIASCAIILEWSCHN